MYLIWGIYVYRIAGTFESQKKVSDSLIAGVIGSCEQLIQGLRTKPRPSARTRALNLLANSPALVLRFLSRSIIIKAKGEAGSHVIQVCF